MRMKVKHYHKQGNGHDEVSFYLHFPLEEDI
jgi:hypothetical protein